MVNESFIFYQSFHKALESLPAENYKNVMIAISKYALYGEEPELDGIEYSIFILMKPQVDANNRRRKSGVENGYKGAEYGKMGGRPKNDNPQETPKKPLDNPQETPKKPLDNPKETPKKPLSEEKKPSNVNDNVNDNVNSDFSFSKNSELNKLKFACQQDVSVRLEKLKLAWNNLDIGPPFPKILVNLTSSESSDFLMSISVWDDDTVIGAMRNYRRVKTEPDYDPGSCVYRSFIGFMSKGVEKYRDEAKPFDLFRKGGTGPPEEFWKNFGVEE
jgi:hypothetical protein